MDYDRDAASEAAGMVRQTIGGMAPRIGILTGTGLQESIAAVEIDAAMDYRHIPHFPLSTVAGHPGRMLAGRLGEKALLVCQGRFHLYEGYPPRAVAFPIRVMQTLGVRTLILLNAAGGLDPAMQPGAVMIIRDHLNLTGANPLEGPNEAAWGPRFPDMSAAYDAALAEAALTAVAESGLPRHGGVYAGLRGPSLETPAEVRFLKAIGAAAVGFSTVLEVIAAVHAGMAVLGLSTITNVHDPDRPAASSLEEILTVARDAAPRVGALLSTIIARL
jgi:purine-nucleoside phosphorylase